MGPEQRDEDLELALSLHRELNGLTRRSRQTSRSYDQQQALKSLKKRREGDDKPSTTSSGGSGRSGGGSGDQQRSKKLKTSSSEGKGWSEGISDPSSGPQASRPGQEAQQLHQDHHSSDRKGSGTAPGGQQQRSMQQQGAATGGEANGATPALPAHNVASAAAAAAQAARSKAAKAANGGGGGGQPHVKCFFAGIRWGALLPPVALRDRASLAAAVSKAFEQDGVRCSEASTHVIFVTTDQQTLEFPSRLKHADAGRQGEWEAAARHAVRVYCRS